MKTWLLIYMFLAFCFVELSANDRNVLPEVIIYSSGAEIRGFEIVEWRKDSIVISRNGVRSPVRFVTLAAEQRKVFESIAAEKWEAGLAKRTAEAERKRKAEAEMRAAADALEENNLQNEKAVEARAIRISMTDEQVLKSWGKPDSKMKVETEQGRSHRWFYGKSRSWVRGLSRPFMEDESELISRDKNESYYLYFEEGLLVRFSTHE